MKKIDIDSELQPMFELAKVMAAIAVIELRIEIYRGVNRYKWLDDKSPLFTKGDWITEDILVTLGDYMEYESPGWYCYSDLSQQR